jgi:hypothetical protein
MCHSASPAQPFTAEQVPLQCYDLGMRKATYTYSLNIKESYVSPLSSMDSGLEAFSRNPTLGSFAALTFQSTAFAN